LGEEKGVGEVIMRRLGECVGEEKKQIMSMMSFNRANVPMRVYTEKMEYGPEMACVSRTRMVGNRFA